MLSDEMKRIVEQDLFLAAQHVTSGRLSAYVAEMKATKPCVVNPDTIDWLLDFFEAFQSQRARFEKHFLRWEAEAARIKKAAGN